MSSPLPSPTSHPAPAAGPTPAPGARLVCLDAYRGFIMVCLAFGGFGLAATADLHLKVAPDSAFWRAVYAQWEHGAWVGCRFWDLIMPAFTFMVGLAMAYSYVRRQREGHTTAQMFRHACVRALLLIAGIAGLVAGYGLDALGLIPAVKRIWTPSFGLLSTGWCLLMLAAFYGMTELRGWTRWTQFFVIAGANSIALYCLSQLLKPWTAALWRSHLGQNVFFLAGPLWEPSLRGLAVGLTFWLVCWWLWRRKIFLRL